VQFPQNNINNIPHPYEKIALKERNDKPERFVGEVCSNPCEFGWNMSPEVFSFQIIDHYYHRCIFIF
jgi:hypothetical protein